jgi:hypothetical protein
MAFADNYFRTPALLKGFKVAKRGTLKKLYYSSKNS